MSSKRIVAHSFQAIMSRQRHRSSVTQCLAVLHLQQNFQRLPQFTQVTKVVMGSSALLVCI